MDVRRKRLLYRATHRGTKESDAIVGEFFLARVESLSEAELADSERLIEENDLDLVNWVTGREPVPAVWLGTIFDALAAHYRTRRP
jgi:antitoxin CptB